MLVLNICGGHFDQIREIDEIHKLIAFPSLTVL